MTTHIILFQTPSQMSFKKLPYWSNFPSNRVSKTPVNQKFNILSEGEFMICILQIKKNSLSAMIIKIPFGYYICSELCKPIFRTVPNFSM